MPLGNLKNVLGNLNILKRAGPFQNPENAHLEIAQILRLYPGIAPGWVYYFRPTIAACAITGTNPYY